MVNTFIVSARPQDTMKILDYKRLGKQRVEANQIINILIGKDTSKTWINSPVVKMWRNHVEPLKFYFNCSVREWVARGYNNNMKIYDDIDEENIKMPWFFSWRSLHLSHMSCLVKKYPEYYEKIFKFETPEEKEFLKYGYLWVQSKEDDYYAYSRKENKVVKIDIEDRDKVVTTYCSNLGAGVPPQYRYSAEVAMKWVENKTVSPLSGKKISLTGTLAKELKQVALFHSLIKEEDEEDSEENVKDKKETKKRKQQPKKEEKKIKKEKKEIKEEIKIKKEIKEEKKGEIKIKKEIKKEKN